MKYKYTKYVPNLLDDLDMDELMSKLSDLLMSSGFGNPRDTGDDSDRTMQALHDAILEALFNGAALRQHRQLVERERPCNTRRDHECDRGAGMRSGLRKRLVDCDRFLPRAQGRRRCVRLASLCSDADDRNVVRKLGTVGEPHQMIIWDDFAELPEHEATAETADQDLQVMPLGGNE